ncbi:ectonucleoside triphosphate diphosphohydrolase 2 [Platysternon megacephalum]|uniref:Ectonucleoside triphosphate diphosphohydrolase 2 n=1 Tax=Platysternon megacephalum TaxID=55544 RepID=A0A4D9DTF2_9SAUR|nr:ectonucleoside triphosphate diphosphohydrolase 2 [Platysternon megacephalum]
MGHHGATSFACAWPRQHLFELPGRTPPFPFQGPCISHSAAPTNSSPLLSWQLDFSMRQVLVLGLEGAGKSSVLHYISSEAAKDRTAPTQGFNSVQVYADGFQIDLLELGGSQNLRFYWNQYLSQAHVLVFVVDSADGPRLPTARQELQWLLAEDPRLPLVVLANKQDKSDALSVAELHRELALHTLNGQREFFLLPTSATHAALATATSIRRVKSLLVELLSQL